MLAGVYVALVLERLPEIRAAKRAGLRRHSTNVGEFARLCSLFGIAFDFRRHAGLPPDSGRFVLRLQRRGATRWHWAICVDGVVFDPGGAIGPLAQMDSPGYPVVSFYEISTK